MTLYQISNKKDLTHGGGREIVYKGDDANIIQTPALGRPFRLGMLYDRVHDTIMPGETLLKMEDMKEHTFNQKKNGTSFEVICGDSLEDKSIVFSGDANLELNVLKGTVTLGSSGKFLKNKISSKKQLRVTLTAEYITSYKELEMKHFELHNSNTNTNATHIVTAIEYGTNVALTFDRTLSNDEDVQEVKGELKGMIDCIPGFQASGKAEINMNKIDKQKTENISCKFYGDIILPVNPTTYEEAVRVYKELPSFLKEEEAVPVTVWLYPITTRATQANKVLQTINKQKMRQTLKAIDDLQRIYVSCNDLMSAQAVMHIPEVQYKIDQFQRAVQTFQEEFQDQFIDGLLKEDEVSKNKMSPWLDTIVTMEDWLSKTTEFEINLLNIYINEIKKEKIEILPTSGVDAKLFEHDHVVILDIGLPFSSRQYVKKEPGTISAKQQSFSSWSKGSMKQETGRHDTTTKPSTNTEEKRWYSDASIKATVRKTIKRLLTLHTEVSNVEYFVTFSDRNDTELHDDMTSCARLVSYENGAVKNIDLLSPEDAEKLF